MVENIELDPEAVDRAFTRGLKNGVNYLRDLEERALQDYELQGQNQMSIQLCFQSLSKFIATRGVKGLSVQDLEDFGLPMAFLPKIQQIIMMLDTHSPGHSGKIGFYSGVGSPPTPAEVLEELEDQYSEDDFDEFEEDDISEAKDEAKELGSNSIEDETREFKQPYSQPQQRQQQQQSQQQQSQQQQQIPKQQQQNLHYNQQRQQQSQQRQPQQPQQQQQQYDQQHEEEVKYMKAVPVPGGKAQRPSTTDAVTYHENSSKLYTPRYDVVSGAANLPARASTGGPVSYNVETRLSTVKKKNKIVPWIENNNWVLGEKIGSGSFGEVFQCMNDKVTFDLFDYAEK